ncbi:UvrD-helicase domain-containing protein [Paenibacillus sp. FSL H8-0260]|uniref:UvrD-helicase domain-containing protein n=1 Tax=Paenibacillus sp. FSL H8-0260 TaxID=2921380 RepID=UPI00324C8473
MFEEIDYRVVEKILLGESNFNEQQKSFIELFESKTIVAGPGAGKTTALAAKIILLLQHLKRTGSSDGLCIITYTNVAVKEINDTLLKAGIGLLTHPHFIGTIHEFFNKFCVIPHFKKEYKHNSLFFSDDDLLSKEFYIKFLTRNHHWMQDKTKTAIAQRICGSKLIYNETTKNLELENTTAWEDRLFTNHKAKMLNAKILRRKNGYLEYDDTFLFSQFFLSDTRFLEIIRKRFKYCFIDEFQDTSVSGLALLRKLFDVENNIMQMIGDPFQTIIYDQPMPRVDEGTVFRLNISNRFGKEISDHLNIIMPEANIQAVENKKSFKPIILLYKEDKDIYTSYRSIISEHEEEHDFYKNCEKEDKVLVWSRGWTSLLKEGKAYSNKKRKSFETKNHQIKHLIIEFICEKIKSTDENHSILKKWIHDHPAMIELNGILVEIIKNGVINPHKENLKILINRLLGEKGGGVIIASNHIFKNIKDILTNTNTFDPKIIDYESSDDIFTIHSVKGETLRSVLVVNFNGGPLTKIMFHKYEIKDDADYIYTDHNLLYVAMSRVTHLFVYALHIDNWNDDVRNKLQDNWTIKDIT